MVNRLLLLNGLAIFNVILFHATGFGFTAMFGWAHRYRPVTSPNYDAVGTPAYYALRLIEQYAVFSIPAFLFVSGFFVSVLAGRHQAGIRPGAIAARIRALLVPYLFWSTVILASLALEGRFYPAARYLRMILTGSTYPAYYWVPLIIQLYALAPMLVWLARRNWHALLAVTALLQVGVYVLQYPLVLGIDAGLMTRVASAIPKWLFAAHLFWFALGVVVGFEQHAFKPVVCRLRWYFLAAGVALLVAGTVEWEVLRLWSGSPWTENRMTLIDGLYAAAMILTFVGFAGTRLPFSEALMDLGGKSFGVYLVHGIVMEYTSRTIYHLVPSLLGHQALFLTLVITLGLSVPLVLMSLVNQSRARGLYPYVFG